MLEDDTFLCRCEEMTVGEIRAAIRAGADTLAAVKRFTRAGMGLCGGRTCSRLVARLLAEQSGRPLSAMEPPSARPPVRPVALGVLAEED